MSRTIGVIGVGSFGEFMLKYLIPYFRVFIYDKFRDVTPITSIYNVDSVTLSETAACDVVVLSVPVCAISTVCKQIAGLLRSGALVVDVSSVKLVTTRVLAEMLPSEVDIVALHPLFGPQSGKHGIHGRNIVLCEVRGNRHECVARFLSESLGLVVKKSTPEEHDREMAYVQGLTHLIAKVIVRMSLPKIYTTTKTFDLLREMVDLVKYDSDELFRAIHSQNPYGEEATARFFDAARELQSYLDCDEPPDGIAIRTSMTKFISPAASTLYRETVSSE